MNVLKSKLRYSNLFRNTTVPNEGRSLNCRLVVAQFPLCSYFNSKVTKPTFTTFLDSVEALVLLVMRASTKRYCIPFRNTREKSEGGQFQRLQKVLKLIGYYSNVSWATAKLMSVLYSPFIHLSMLKIW